MQSLKKIGFSHENGLIEPDPFEHIEEKLHFYSKVEDKDQKSIQSSTTTDQGQRMGK